MLKPVRGQRSGFTLMEVLAAMTLTVIICVALLGSHSSIRQSVHVSRDSEEALNLARSYLEEEKARSYDVMASDNHPGTTISDNGTESVLDDLTGTAQVTVADNGNKTKTLRSTVIWNERMMGQTIPRSVSLTTLVAENE